MAKIAHLNGRSYCGAPYLFLAFAPEGARVVAEAIARVLGS